MRRPPTQPSRTSGDAGSVPDLRVKDLVISGTDGRVLLAVPDLEVPAGSAVAIRGPSGAGKSTLLHALSGLMPVTRGRILWGGLDIAALSDEGRAAFRRERIGFVFQEHLLFEELPAAQNASLAAMYAPRAARAALRARGAEKLRSLGLDPDAIRASGSYSGGERQRIAVARALAGDPAVLLADEPTASLDRGNADRLAADLIRLSREEGRTLIAVSHDPAFHAAADRVIDLADGRLGAGGRA
ncbi:ABC transporter ATP-binding protein [Rhodobacter sp. NSM]|uniref:ABC transporter ATP-binding protein n=1 Tax=Rhodobacter sp. NSM TaxID=3457501 RepID=UPI003FD6AE67